MSYITNIDTLIETYDVRDDPILLEYYTPIRDMLWRQIENYGKSINEYGDVLSQHLINTSKLGEKFIVESLGFSEKAGRNFYDANLLQDLGKTHFSYDPNIWQTPHRPTEQERKNKREHSRLGVELLDLALTKSPEELQLHPHITVTQCIQRYHHERIDGTGDEGLTGDKQGIIIKAMCIVDAFDGDMIYRPHQTTRRTSEEALKRMSSSEKYQGAFDKAILEQFIDFIHAQG